MPKQQSMNNRKLRVIYRISNNSYSKEKLWGDKNKEICLGKMLDQFWGWSDVVNIHIIKDNVTDPHTINFIDELIEHAKYQQSLLPDPSYTAVITTEDTNLGNAQSFWHAYRNAIDVKNFSSADDVVYLLEDDYFHLNGSFHCLMEGIERADYVSLYDHPDKYINRIDGGDNPYIENGGEVTRLILTDSSHWKLTNSTTMTFAAKIKTLIRDFDIWQRHTSNGNHPNDFGAFIELRQRGASLITPVPGLSTHTELKYLTPFVLENIASQEMYTETEYYDHMWLYNNLPNARKR